MSTENFLERNKLVYLHMKSKLDFNSSNLDVITQNINLIEKIGQFAWRNHPGCFFDAEIENLLLGYGQKLENFVDVEGISREIENLFEVHKENSTLHVASEIANIGGHTRVINQMVKRSKEKKQGFILTKREVESVPIWFKEGVDEYAKILSLFSYNSPLDRAYALKIISKRFKRIILYHHPFDVIPTLAFANAGTIPVIVENHAHSWFWFGKSITDMVFSHTEFHTKFTERYRRIENSFYLHFTQSDNIETHLEVDQKRQAREILRIDTNKTIILTVATREKLIPNSEYNFFEIAENILQKNLEVVFIIVGLSENDVLVQSFNKSERVFIYPPTPDLKIFYLASDICLEAMPQPSLGVQLQAPINGLSCPFPKYGKSKVFRSYMLSQSKLYSKHFGKEMTENEFYEKIQHFINNPQLCLAVAQDIRSNLMEKQSEQVLYENILKMYNEIDSLSHTTKFLEKTIFHVDEENNEIAERSELQSWSEVLDFWRSEINNNELSGVDFEKFQDREKSTNKSSVRVIAIYLPQFHPIPENDKAWGKGFTEWTNVKKATPLYPTHFQPNVPLNDNYYDLRSDEIRKQQIDLAKEHGIQGFCYYYYWFNGKEVLETPIKKMLKNKELDFPFCICWANENWTKRWDGKDDDIIIPQHHNFEDDYNFIHSLFPYFDDERYITINDKPVVVIYRTELFPDIKKTASIWREETKKAGYRGIYLIRVEGFERNINPADIGFDASMEFAPAWHELGDNLNEKGRLYNDLQDLRVHSYKTMVENMMRRTPPQYKMFRSVTPSWDNTPRKGVNGLVIENSSAENYEYWLTKAINYTDSKREGDEKLVFINAWNEWGEGNYLEPDEKNGYAYLKATANAINNNVAIDNNKSKVDLGNHNDSQNDDMQATINVIDNLVLLKNYFEAYLLLQSLLEENMDLDWIRNSMDDLSKKIEIERETDRWDEAKSQERLLQVEEAINAQQLTEAKNVLIEILNHDPENLDALNNLSVVHILEGEIEFADELIDLVLTINPNDEIALSNLEYLTSNFDNRENEASIDSNVELLQEDTNNNGNKNGDLESKDKEIENLKADLKKISTNLGDYRKNKLLQANELINQKRNDDSVLVLQGLLELFPNDTIAMSMLGQIYFHTADYVKASEYFEKVLELEPGNKLALSVLQDIRGNEDNSECTVPYFSHKGYCPCCEQEVVFESKNSWFRDNLLCKNCYSIPRERALVVTIEKYFPNWKDLRIHESSPSSRRGASLKLKNNVKNYVASYYYPNKPLGEVVNNYLNQDLENQTFSDESFDIVITQDVMEHIFNPQKAFSEIARTLRPGGAHIFTVPIINKHNKTEVWATKGGDGTPLFTKTPEWHGNPIDSKGSPVTMHWGFDIVEFIKESSELETKIEFIDNLDLGIQAEYIEVLVSKKEEIINKSQDISGNEDKTPNTEKKTVVDHEKLFEGVRNKNIPLLSSEIDGIANFYNELVIEDPDRIEMILKRKKSINKSSVRVIAIYLPQFHPIPENDKAWGKGFTEWTNVKKATPLYPTHYQPHVPLNNYYDLRSDEVRKEQIELAKEYGINGFCYYHYWFNGKEVLETPIKKLLANKELDFPFCICWANENWTKRWDGKDDDIIIPQNHSFEDDHNFIHSLFPYFDDERYITINDKPVVVIYRTELFPDIKKTASIWREETKKAGYRGIYLIRVEGFERNINPVEIGFDASMEFAPDWHELGDNLNEKGRLYSNLEGLKVHSYKTMIENMMRRPPPQYKMFRTVTPSWDNTPRKGVNGLIIENSSAENYEYWLTKAINYTDRKREGEEKLVFINAWNEWGEGNYLEPDEKNGYAYLKATANATKNGVTIDTKNTAWDAQINLVQNLVEVQSYCEAYFLLQSILRENPNLEWVKKNLAILYKKIESKRIEDKWNSKKSQEMLLEAEKHIEDQQLSKAKNVLVELLNYDPENLDALNDLSVVHILENKNEFALDLIDIVLFIDPENEIAKGNYDYVMENQQQNNDTMEEDTVQFDENKNKIKKAEKLIENNQMEDARVILNELIENDNSNINALNDLAIIFILTDKLEKAMNMINRVLEIEPKNKIALENYQYIKENYEAANRAEPNDNNSSVVKPILTIGLLLATRHTPGYNSFVPLGIGYLEKYISKSLPEVKVIFAEVLEELIQAKPDIIGISSTTENYHIAINNAIKIKEKLGIPVILGGIHISLLPESLQDCFDLAVIGEGEITLVEVLKLYIRNGSFNKTEMKEIPGLLFKENGALFQTQNRQVVDNLDSLPKPVIDELPFYNSKMVGCIVSARGCPYKCSFCASEKFAHHYRTLSTDLIVDEVEYMIKEKSIRHIVFYDDLLIANKKKVIELISILDKKELLGKCSFSCQVRANLITDEICLLLKKLNVVDVGIGIESFSDKILDYYNKKGVTSEINQRAIDLLNKHGIKVNPSIILGAPIETKEDLLITLRAVYNNIKDSKITSPAWGTLRPYPGTKIWDYAESVGIVSANMDWERFSDWSNFETYLCKQIPKSEFYEIIDEWITKISILAIDRPRVEGNFVIKNPEALSEKIKYFQQKLKKRTVYDLGDELIMEYKD